VQRIFIKKCFLFTVGSVCRVKRFTTGSRNSLKDVPKSQMMKRRCRLRQQSKDFYAAGFDALVKIWNKCTRINVEGYVEKWMFFSRFEYHIFYILYLFVTYLLTLLRISRFPQTFPWHVTYSSTETTVAVSGRDGSVETVTKLWAGQPRISGRDEGFFCSQRLDLLCGQPSPLSNE
jgi:hypothetical protein